MEKSIKSIRDDKGQTCVAMIADVSVDKVIRVMNNDKGTGKKDTCYSHWVLYYHGKYYDPEFGLMDELYCKAKIQSYLELYVD